MFEQSKKAYIHSDRKSSKHSLGIGWADGGRFAPGNYTVELSVDGVKIGEGSFLVTNSEAVSSTSPDATALARQHDSGTEEAIELRSSGNANLQQDKQAPTEYSCSTSLHQGVRSGLENLQVDLFDQITRSRVGTFEFSGSLWFFGGGNDAEVGENTRLLNFSFGDYHPDPETLKLCASGKYFVLSSGSRRFRIEFPSLTPAALILEIKSNTSISASAPPSAPSSEESAWEVAEKNGTPDAYLRFATDFPQSSHIKTAVGTLRGRYWFKLNMPFESNDGSRRDGVVVTVDGMKVAKNLSLAEAKRLGVVAVSPARSGADRQTQATTFNHAYVEATGGGVVVGNDLIAPEDLLNSILIFSGDGTRLLAWDIGKATPAPQPSRQPTIIKGADGKPLCGEACP